MARKKKMKEMEIEDVTPIETVQDPADSLITIEEESSNSEEPQELTPEQKEQQESFMRGMIISRFKTTLRDIYNYMRYENRTLEEVREEVVAKVSPLTASRREFILGFKLEFIQQLLDDMYKLKITE